MKNYTEPLLHSKQSLVLNKQTQRGTDSRISISKIFCSTNELLQFGYNSTILKQGKIKFQPIRWFWPKTRFLKKRKKKKEKKATSWTFSGNLKSLFCSKIRNITCFNSTRNLKNPIPHHKTRINESICHKIFKI